MGVPRTIEVEEVIDQSRIGVFQIVVLGLCGLAVIMDGFDVQVIGYVAPTILREWNADKASLGPVFGAGILGLVLGSLLLGMLADRIGRRPVLIGSILFFSVCMLLTVRVTSINQLTVMRFITGLGLGSIMPNAMSLATEFSPRRRRVTLTTAVSACFAVGAVFGGLVSAAMIPRWGWQSVFYLGSVAPIAIAVLMLFYLPESPQFLALRGKGELVGKWMRRVDPAIPDDGREYVSSGTTSRRASVILLFRDGRRKTTILLWMASFLNLLVLFFLSNWLPTIVVDDGLPMSTAVLAGTALQFWGVVGGVSMGKTIDRVGFRKVLIPCFCTAALAIFILGRPSASLVLLFAAASVSGCCIVGGQQALNALSASYYPTPLRSTGTGWTLGIGRLGSIIGPVIGGELIGMSLPKSTLFLIVAIPALLCAAMIWAMDKEQRQSAPASAVADGRDRGAKPRSVARQE